MEYWVLCCEKILKTLGCPNSVSKALFFFQKGRQQQVSSEAPWGRPRLSGPQEAEPPQAGPRALGQGHNAAVCSGRLSQSLWVPPPPSGWGEARPPQGHSGPTPQAASGTLWWESLRALLLGPGAPRAPSPGGRLSAPSLTPVLVASLSLSPPPPAAGLPPCSEEAQEEGKWGPARPGPEPTSPHSSRLL